MTDARYVEQYYTRTGRYGIRDVRTLAQEGHRVLKLLGVNGPDLKQLQYAIRCREGMIAESDAELTAMANLTTEKKLPLV